MERAKKIGDITIEQYRSRKWLSTDVQVLNTRLFYDYILLKRTPAISTFIDLVSNYNFVIHSIASMALQRMSMPKEPTQCTLTTLQDMVHNFRTVFDDSIDSYGGDIWAMG
eukprot:2094025-Ditylum_brightwellii.AAC.1